VLVAFPAIPASGTVRIKAVTEDYGACEFDLYIEFVRMSDWLLKWIIWTAVICAVILLLGYIVLFVRPYSHTLHIAPVDSAGAIKAESVYVNGFSLLPISMKNVKSNAKKITSPDKLKYWDELNLNGFFYSAGNKGVRFIPEKRVFVVQSAGEPPKEKRAVTIAKNSHITVYSDSFHTRGIEIKYN